MGILLWMFVGNRDYATSARVLTYPTVDFVIELRGRLQYSWIWQV